MSPQLTRQQLADIELALASVDLAPPRTEVEVHAIVRAAVDKAIAATPTASDSNRERALRRVRLERRLL